MTVQITRFDELDYAATEAFNTLRTNLSFAGPDKRVIMVTSCQAAEGKSFISFNIAHTIAQLGKGVVLVDADLRRSVMNTKYGIRLPGDEFFGLAHYLAGMCSVDRIVYDTNLINVSMVPVGRVVSNSLALLSTILFEQMIRHLSSRFDYVIVDAPPVGVIIDAAEIAKSCDGALLAVSQGKVSRRELKEVKQQIEVAGCEVLGAILNNVDIESISNKKYYYKRSYDAAYHDARVRPMPMFPNTNSSIQGKEGSNR